MACFFPSNVQEAWFPQLRINRLAMEAAAVKAKLEANESVTPKPKRKAAPAD